MIEKIKKNILSLKERFIKDTENIRRNSLSINFFNNLNFFFNGKTKLKYIGKVIYDKNIKIFLNKKEYIIPVKKNIENKYLICTRVNLKLKEINIEDFKYNSGNKKLCHIVKTLYIDTNLEIKNNTNILKKYIKSVKNNEEKIRIKKSFMIFLQKINIEIKKKFSDKVNSLN
ncbi:hypothetical protein ACWNYO_00510 [Candidatus Vidania fulgoroideorum]